MAKKHEQNKIQLLAETFFNDKNEKNFAPIFEELSAIVRSAIGSITKNDEEIFHTIKSEIGMKIWIGTKNKKEESIFDPEKSFLSWIFVTARNQAIQSYRKKKNRHEILEGEMFFEDSKTSAEVFENLIPNHEQEELEPEQGCFHSDIVMQSQFIEEKLKELYQGEEYEILRKAIILRISPEEIAKEYNINSRVTITSRNRRARTKIKALLESEIEKSKRQEDKTINGKVETISSDCLVMCSRTSGKLNGEYTKTHNNGVILEKGLYENGTRVGVWQEKNELGILTTQTHYEETIKKYHFDRFGEIMETELV